MNIQHEGIGWAAYNVAFSAAQGGESLAPERSCMTRPANVMRRSTVPHSSETDPFWHINHMHFGAPRLLGMKNSQNRVKAVAGSQVAAQFRFIKKPNRQS